MQPETRGKVTCRKMTLRSPSPSHRLCVPATKGKKKKVQYEEANAEEDEVAATKLMSCNE